MPKRARANGFARPVTTQRDYENAAAVAKRLADLADRDSAAEKRLQSLLKELDKYDDLEDEAGDDHSELHYEGPRRRWTDNGSDDS